MVPDPRGHHLRDHADAEQDEDQGAQELGHEFPDQSPPGRCVCHGAPPSTRDEKGAFRRERTDVAPGVQRADTKRKHLGALLPGGAPAPAVETGNCAERPARCRHAGPCDRPADGVWDTDRLKVAHAPVAVR
ncbi:hypothetical protein GCM10010524_39840 [Streptomyces mexicanus]